MLKDIDGLIVIGRISPDTVEKMTNRMEHIVFINHYADEDLYDCVHVDFVRAADRAIRHLQSLGCTHLGYIGGKEREHYFEGNAVIEDERQTTFMRRMQEAGGLHLDDIHIGEYSMQEGYTLMRQAIKKETFHKPFLSEVIQWRSVQCARSTKAVCVFLSMYPLLGLMTLKSLHFQVRRLQA